MINDNMRMEMRKLNINKFIWIILIKQSRQVDSFLRRYLHSATLPIIRNH